MTSSERVCNSSGVAADAVGGQHGAWPTVRRGVTAASVVALAMSAAGCSCTSRVGVESAPPGAEIYLRGDKEVTFSPIPKVVGGASGGSTMTTPDNLTLDWALLDSLAAGGAKEKVWVKVRFPGAKETEPVEVKKCENVLLKFEGTGGKKEEVQLVSQSKTVLRRACL